MVVVGVAGVSCVAVAVGCGWLWLVVVGVIFQKFLLLCGGAGGRRSGAVKVCAFGGRRTSGREQGVFCEHVCDVRPIFILCSFFVVFVSLL